METYAFAEPEGFAPRELGFFAVNLEFFKTEWRCDKILLNYSKYRKRQKVMCMNWIYSINKNTKRIDVYIFIYIYSFGFTISAC